MKNDPLDQLRLNLDKKAPVASTSGTPLATSRSHTGDGVVLFSVIKWPCLQLTKTPAAWLRAK